MLSGCYMKKKFKHSAVMTGMRKLSRLYGETSSITVGIRLIYRDCLTGRKKRRIIKAEM
jgi:hypothetical protein